MASAAWPRPNRPCGGPCRRRGARGEGERFLDLIELAGDPAKAASADRIGRALASDPQDVPGLMAMAACEQREHETEAKKTTKRPCSAFPAFSPPTGAWRWSAPTSPEGDAKAH